MTADMQQRPWRAWEVTAWGHTVYVSAPSRAAAAWTVAGRMMRGDCWKRGGKWPVERVKLAAYVPADAAVMYWPGRRNR